MAAGYSRRQALARRRPTRPVTVARVQAAREALPWATLALLGTGLVAFATHGDAVLAAAMLLMTVALLLSALLLRLGPGRELRSLARGRSTYLATPLRVWLTSTVVASFVAVGPLYVWSQVLRLKVAVVYAASSGPTAVNPVAVEAFRRVTYLMATVELAGLACLLCLAFTPGPAPGRVRQPWVRVLRDLWAP